MTAFKQYCLASGATQGYNTPQLLDQKVSYFGIMNL